MPTNPRREARLARELEKKLREQGKAARLRERPDMRTSIRVAEPLPPERNIRTGADPGSIYQMTMTWTADGADRAGRWSWGVDRDWGDAAWNDVIHPKLKQWEQLRWGEIEAFASGEGHRMHHLMPVEVVCSEAQQRMIEIDQFHDDIYRFRLGNRPRLWGLRIVNEFQILWFDPTHRIYPTEPE